MKYNCLDFAILCAANDKVNTEEDILTSVSKSFPYPPSFFLFSSCVKKLHLGGYITYNLDGIYPTEKCKKLFKTKKMFESRDKFISRLEDEFLSLEAEADSTLGDIDISEHKYNSAFKRMENSYTFSSDVRFCEREGDKYLLITPPCDTGEYLDGEISKSDILTLPYESNKDAAEHIFESAAALAYPSKAKKVYVSDGNASYVMTMAQEGSKIKVSIQKILFNSKRFIGKRDSQLDYAQCADTCISFYTTQNTLYMSAALLLLECECRKG